MPRPFLTASWTNLVVLNWEVGAEILQPLVPRGVVLDKWQGRSFLSLVAFQFRNTKVLGLPIPFHTDFIELNLRFYVKREMPGEERRGAVFVKEIVSKPAIAMVARLLYNENYHCHPTYHSLHKENGMIKLSYGCQTEQNAHLFLANGSGLPQSLHPGSLEEFVLEHYWGYTKQRNGRTLEYKVEHPSWKVWSTPQITTDFDPIVLYGKFLGGQLMQAPSFAIIADGSDVVVYKGDYIA